MNLIEAVGMRSEGARERHTPTRVVLYRASKGNALILGYSGMTNQDHFEHFYRATDALVMLSIPAAP